MGKGIGPGLLDLLLDVVYITVLSKRSDVKQTNIF